AGGARGGPRAGPRRSAARAAPTGGAQEAFGAEALAQARPGIAAGSAELGGASQSPAEDRAGALRLRRPLRAAGAAGQVLLDGAQRLGVQVPADPQGQAVLDLQAKVGQVLHSGAHS